MASKIHPEKDVKMENLTKTIPKIFQIVYPKIMFAVFKPSLFVLLLFLCSCGIFHDSPGEISNQFYASQQSESVLLTSELFSNINVQEKTESLLLQRKRLFGNYQSHKKIGFNRRVSIDDQGRLETFIYIFEVSCENGHTIETVAISRRKLSEPYYIMDYEVKNISKIQNPSSSETSST